MTQALAFMVLAFSFNQDIKLPIPSAAEQKKAEAEVRAVFKEEFSKKDREGKRTLAKRLFGEAQDEKNTSASRYAVLLLSRDLASESLDIDTLFKSIESIEKLYDVAKPALAGATFTNNLNGLKIEALNKAQKTVASADDSAILGDAYLKVAEDALSEKVFEDAQSAAQASEKYGRSAKSPGIADRASTLQKEISELWKEDEEFGRVITMKIDDPAAKLVKGRYFLFVAGDEKDSLQFLIGCSDEGLKNVAKLEQGAPSTPEGMMGVGEAWYTLAGKESSLVQKRRYKERAYKWFDLALKDAGGIQRTKIEKRLSELGPKASGPVTGLVGYWSCDEGTGESLRDPSMKANHGKQSGAKWVSGISGGALAFNGKDAFCTLGTNGLPDIQAQKSISFWYCSESVPGPEIEQAQVMVALGSDNGATVIGFWQSKIMVWGAGGMKLGAVSPPTVGKWHHIAYVFDGTTHRVYVDGTLQDTTKEKLQAGPSKKLELGRWSTGQYLNGSLDEIRVYNRHLAEPEILSLSKAKK